MNGYDLGADYLILQYQPPSQFEAGLGVSLREAERHPRRQRTKYGAGVEEERNLIEPKPHKKYQVSIPLFYKVKYS